MPTLCLIYVPCPSPETAEEILIPLLQDRLVACGNISAPVTSLFRWNGKTEKASETILILKTRASLFESARERIESLHPYDVPCILKLPVEASNVAFRAWIKEETEEK